MGEGCKELRCGRLDGVDLLWSRGPTEHCRHACVRKRMYIETLFSIFYIFYFLYRCSFEFEGSDARGEETKQDSFVSGVGSAAKCSK